MKIWLETNINAHNFIPKTYWQSNYAMVKCILPNAEIYVSKTETSINGFIGIMNSSYIAGLFVLNDFQGQGIGKNLLNHCKNIYSILALDVYEANKKAVAFYINNDFKILSEKTNSDTGFLECSMQWERINCDVFDYS